MPFLIMVKGDNPTNFCILCKSECHSLFIKVNTNILKKFIDVSTENTHQKYYAYNFVHQHVHVFRQQETYQ